MHRIIKENAGYLASPLVRNNQHTPTSTTKPGAIDDFTAKPGAFDDFTAAVYMIEIDF